MSFWVMSWGIEIPIDEGFINAVEELCFSKKFAARKAIEMAPGVFNNLVSRFYFERNIEKGVSINIVWTWIIKWYFSKVKNLKNMWDGLYTYKIQSNSSIKVTQELICLLEDIEEHMTINYTAFVFPYKPDKMKLRVQDVAVQRVMRIMTQWPIKAQVSRTPSSIAFLRKDSEDIDF